MPALPHLTALAALAMMGLGMACGQTTGEAADSRPPVAHTVTMEASAFSPADFTARPGDTVTFTNKDFFPHTATAADVFDSGALQPGASWTLTVGGDAESISYLCLLHPTMTGTIRVER